MATGEFTSVRSQNELVGSEVDVERRSLADHPEQERREMVIALTQQGVEVELAQQVAQQISIEPNNALRFHTQEELGVDPDQLPSPYQAAGSSFISFAIGAFIPLLPYLLGATVLWISLVAAAIALVVSGAAVARLTGRSMVHGAVRQVALAALSAGVTYGVGRAIGASVS